MDPDTVRMLEDVPADLIARGWALVQRESKIVRTRAAASHVAVYERPYHSPVDHLGTAITVRAGKVHVSTAQAQSPSWEAAREEAIVLMRAIDAPRQAREDAAQ